MVEKRPQSRFTLSSLRTILSYVLLDAAEAAPGNARFWVVA
jgi:hypothetical protein